MGCTHPPTATKKQTTRLPLIFNLSLCCPACPRGVGHGASTGPPGGGGTPGFAQRDCRSPLSSLVSPSDRGKRTQDAGDGEGLGQALRHPLPHRVPCSPAETACEARALQRLDWGRGEREGRSPCPPRGPSTTCPPLPTAVPTAPWAAAGAALSAPFAPRCP